MSDACEKRLGDTAIGRRLSIFLDWCLDRITRRSVRRPGPRIYACGTLRYTTFGLFMVFFWLLWGDFTMSLMEEVLPAVLPLQFKALGASNKVMAVLLSTIPATMNFCVNPIISFRSDRFRSKWGRRIPFLIGPTPCIAAALVAIAYAPEIGAWAHGLIAARGVVGRNTVIIATLGVLLVIFQFFNMFIASVYYYLFNDTVSSQYLARFMATFRVVGALASMTFNYFLFPHAQTHMRMIFMGAAALYFFGFISMCFGLKEGEYPPPPPLAGNRKGVWASIKTYALECFTHPYYLNIFAYGACAQVAGACMFVTTLFYLHLGISLNQLGKFNAMMQIPGLILMIPLGIICDRLHPLRVLIWTMLLLPLLSLASFFFVHDFRSMVAVALIGFPIMQFLGASRAPLLWLLFPKERFGQFGSAEAMARSIASIIASVLAGFFLDAMKGLYHGDEEYYRGMYLWAFFFQMLACFFIWRVYAGWKKHGGLKNYHAPSAGFFENAPAANGQL
jgi:Na+/melibiose symporter-like transporter